MAPPEKQGANDANNFRRDYAAALAQALRESEENNRQPPSDEELLQETYVQLCYDDPIVTESGCNLLAAALIRPKQPGAQKNQQAYALSNQLMEGIRQATSRISRDPPQSQTKNYNRNDAASTAPAAEDELSEQQGQQSLMMKPRQGQQGAGESACALLAWTVYVRIPLLCLLSDCLEDAKRYMGSYRPSMEPVSGEKKNGNDGDKCETKVNTSSKAIKNEQKHEIDSGEAVPPVGNENGPTDSDSLAEVWAEESDPSDFVFESDFNYQQQLAELDTWTSQLNLDPLELSKSPASTTWADLARGVNNLLRDCSFTKISTLSLHQWKQLRVSDYLTQMILTMLLPEASQSPLLEQEKPERWQQLSLQPLHLFRDAVLHHKANFLIDDYLRLLQTLIKVDGTQGQIHGMKNTSSPLEKTSVAPATWLGLSSLSVICSELLDTVHIAVLRTAVLESCDDVSALLEKVADSDASSQIQWACLSLFQTLVATPNTARGAAQPKPPLSNQQSQTLLNSGLFRQWMLWWEKTTDSTVEQEVKKSIFDLCLCSPKLLGKYAWRLPGVAVRVTTLNDDDCALVDTILWNLLGSHLASSTSSASVVKWKDSKLAANVAPTSEACRQTAMTAFQTLCQKLIDILKDWKTRREDNTPSSVNHSSEQLVVSEFSRLVERLSNPLLLNVFVETAIHAQKSKVETSESFFPSELRFIEEVLVRWPSVSCGEIKPKLKLDDEDEDNNYDDLLKKSSSKGQVSSQYSEDNGVGSVRKSIKKLKSAFESSLAGEQQLSVSSKAD